MNLIVALEEEFEVRFEDNDMIDMVNFKIIYVVVKAQFKS